MAGTVKIQYTVNVSNGGVTKKENLEANIPESDLKHFKEKYNAKEIGKSKPEAKPAAKPAESKNK